MEDIKRKMNITRFNRDNSHSGMTSKQVVDSVKKWRNHWLYSLRFTPLRLNYINPWDSGLESSEL